MEPGEAFQAGEIVQGSWGGWREVCLRNSKAGEAGGPGEDQGRLQGPAGPTTAVLAAHSEAAEIVGQV